MRFSIITVCYNSSATIKSTLDSVDMQTYNNFEHLVIDGKSTDGTLDILDRHLSPNRKVVSELDTGLYDAMNKGIEMSSGEYVLFLNADDVFNGNKSLETLACDIDLKSPEIIMNSIQYFGDGSNRKWIIPSK
jgi:glycosyltransferase involved in cell wall biosynthesis